MALTVTQCADWIRLTLGGTPSGTAGVLDLVNLAGMHLVGMTRWRFLEGADVLLSTVASQEYIDLPSNFSSPLSICGVSINADIAWRSREVLARMRQDYVVTDNGGQYFVAVEHAAATGSTPPTARLSIYPAPPNTEADVFRLTYRAGWAKLTSDADYVPIPIWAEALFLRILGAFARGFHREEQGSVDARLAEIQAGPIFSAAVKEDKTKQIDHGPMRGAIHQSGWRDGNFPRYWTSTGP